MNKIDQITFAKLSKLLRVFFILALFPILSHGATAHLFFHWGSGEDVLRLLNGAQKSQAKNDNGELGDDFFKELIQGQIDHHVFVDNGYGLYVSASPFTSLSYGPEVAILEVTSKDGSAPLVETDTNPAPEEFLKAPMAMYAGDLRWALVTRGLNAKELEQYHFHLRLPTENDAQMVVDYMVPMQTPKMLLAMANLFSIALEQHQTLNSANATQKFLQKIFSLLVLQMIEQRESFIKENWNEKYKWEEISFGQSSSVDPKTSAFHLASINYAQNLHLDPENPKFYERQTQVISNARKIGLPSASIDELNLILNEIGRQTSSVGVMVPLCSEVF
ncbi:MAG: hypothetical protein ACXWRE_17065 [Pseudobdellovibrionaceae bacterium]